MSKADDIEATLAKLIVAHRKQEECILELARRVRMAELAGDLDPNTVWTSFTRGTDGARPEHHTFHIVDGHGTEVVHPLTDVHLSLWPERFREAHARKLSYQSRLRAHRNSNMH